MSNIRHDCAHIRVCRYFCSETCLHYDEQVRAESHTMLSLHKKITREYIRIMAHREKLIEVFIAETGLKPSEVEQMEQTWFDPGCMKMCARYWLQKKSVRNAMPKSLSVIEEDVVSEPRVDMLVEELRTMLEEAHKAGQANAGVDPGYSNAQAHVSEILKTHRLT